MGSSHLLLDYLLHRIWDSFLYDLFYMDGIGLGNVYLDDGWEESAVIKLKAKRCLRASIESSSKLSKSFRKLELF